MLIPLANVKSSVRRRIIVDLRVTIHICSVAVRSRARIGIWEPDNRPYLKVGNDAEYILQSVKTSNAHHVIKELTIAGKLFSSTTLSRPLYFDGSYRVAIERNGPNFSFQPINGHITEKL